MSYVPITSGGLEHLKHSITDVKDVQLPNIIAAISEAASHGDLKENAEYHSAKEKKAFLSKKLAYLEKLLLNVRVITIDDIEDKSVIRFGCSIDMVDLDTDKNIKYKIVGEYEAKVEDGLLSINSPLGKALIGKKKDDIFDFNTPSGDVKSYHIIDISYGKL